MGVKLDRAAIGRLAESDEMRRLVAEAAEKVAENVREQGIRVEGIPGDIELPVKVTVYETDRARASVTLAHPAGLAVQAKHGALTRAASALGLTVKGESPNDLIDYTTKAGVTRKATRAQVANWTRG